MELHFSRNRLLNTVLRDAQGKPIYRIETPFKLTNRTTIVSRILPGPSTPRELESDNAPAGESSREVRGDNASDTDILLAGIEEHVVGEILWQELGQSIFKFNGKEQKLKEYLPASNPLARKRRFVAADGKEYKWTLGPLRCWMKRNDKSDDVLARYHRRSLGIIGKAHLPWLEVSEDVLPILDEVILTFLWCERKRQKRERHANGHGG